MWSYSEEAVKNNPDAQIRKVWIHICERKELVHFLHPLGIRTGGLAILSQPRDKGRRGGKMCTERHRQMWSQIVCFQSPYFYTSRFTIIHTCFTHALTLYVCMNVVCLHACRYVHAIWVNMNLMLSMHPNFANMANTVTEIWFTK